MSAKTNAAKKREKEKQRQAQELKAVEANCRKLQTLTSGFARTPRTPQIEAEFLRAKIPSYPKSGHTNTRSLAERFPVIEVKTKQQLSEEMAERERKAKERYREIQNRIGPAYNKGGDQLLSESEYAAMKKGELRRR
jgi:hypothetical protein